MGSQSQAQAPQQPHARPMGSHGISNGNGLGSGGGSMARIPSLARQTSIFSATLDELQRSVMNQEPGQTFGSMNMDEFLKNIWTIEESQAMAQAMSLASDGEGRPEEHGAGGDNIAAENGLHRQPSLVKQPSLSLPRILSRKTVYEVWRDIVKSNPTLAPNGGDDAADVSDEPADVSDPAAPGLSASDAQRQTYGEMTLEAFLVKAGVVKDGGLPEQPSTPYSLFSPYPANNGTAGVAGDRSTNDRERMGPGSFATTLSLSPANGLSTQAEMEAYKQQGQVQAQQQQVQQQQGQVDWLRNIQQQQQAQQQQHMYHQQAQADAYAMHKRVGNGGMLPNMTANGGYTGMASALAPGLAPMGIQLAGPMTLALAPNSPSHSPVSDGVGHSHGNGLSLSPVGNYAVDGGMRGRKRGADGPVEKVVERRQRRMIKNRESAARSRARKQAYTIELEAEVTQLKEENSKLRREKEEEASRNKKLVLERILNDSGKGNKLRRTRTGPW